MPTLDDVKRKYLDVLYLFDKKQGQPHHRMALDIISDELEVAKSNSNLIDFENMLKRLDEIEAGLN